MSSKLDLNNMPLNEITLLEASAGTGKTYALERIVAALLFQGMKIQEILVVTFTNRAAREMRQRIRRLIVERTADSQREESERECYRRALSSFHLAPIYTIHSFCKSVLSSWPFESNVPFAQETKPGHRMEREETSFWLAGLSRENMNPALLEAAFQKCKNTENLINEIVSAVVGDSIPAYSNVLPTLEESKNFAKFLDGLSEETHNLSRASDDLFKREWSIDSIKEVIKTGDGTNKRTDSLEDIQKHMNLCRDVRGIEKLDSEVFCNKHFCQLLGAGKIAHQEKRELKLEESQELAQTLSSFCDTFFPAIDIEIDGSEKVSAKSLVGDFLKLALIDIGVEAVRKKVEERKNESGRWGYKDLILRVEEALKGENSPLKELLRRRYKAALIDEFQDTDPLQWNLFYSLFKNRTLVLLGDPKQSIYGFRGTGLQAYKAARSKVSAKNIHNLDTNYRSAESLVRTQNQIFPRVFNRGAGTNEPVGYTEVASGRILSRTLVFRGRKASTVFLRLSSDKKKEEAACEAIVAEIRTILDPKEGAFWEYSDGSHQPVLASDIAVLVRKSYYEGSLTQALLEAGIPSICPPKKSIFQQPMALSLRIFLEALNQPRNLALWRSVLMDTFVSIPPNLLVEFENRGFLDGLIAEGVLWRQMFQSGGAVEAMKSFFAFTSQMGDWASQCGQKKTALALKNPWTRRVLSNPDGERHWQDLQHLIELIQIRQTAGDNDIPRILEWLEDCSQEDVAEGENEVRIESEFPAVTVMTMHKSKGLEFPLVFLHGGYDVKKRGNRGVYKFEKNGTLVLDRLCRLKNKSLHAAYEWEEEKRLWYVSLTRASLGVWIPLSSKGEITQIESLFSEALDNSDAKLPLHLITEKKEAEECRTTLHGKIAEMVEENLDLFEIKNQKELSLSPLSQPSMREFKVAPLPSQCTVNRDSRTSSYSSLIHQHQPSVSDREKDNISLPETLKNHLLTDDRGTTFGTFLHAIFEQCNYGLASDCEEWFRSSENEKIFLDLASRYYSRAWYTERRDKLKAMVRNSLTAQIPNLGRLCDMAVGSNRREVTFLISIPQAASFHIHENENPILLEQGYLGGVVDVVTKVENQWWIIDWKTNFPNIEEIDENHLLNLEKAVSTIYKNETLSQMMNSQNYHAQYEIYLLSLCKTLSVNRKSPVHWDKEIGGAAYVFIRGTRENENQGIYIGKPKLQRMIALSEEMGFPRIIV